MRPFSQLALLTVSLTAMAMGFLHYLALSPSEIDQYRRRESGYMAIGGSLKRPSTNVKSADCGRL